MCTNCSSSETRKAYGTSFDVKDERVTPYLVNYYIHDKRILNLGRFGNRPLSSFGLLLACAPTVPAAKIVKRGAPVSTSETKASPPRSERVDPTNIYIYIYIYIHI